MTDEPVSCGVDNGLVDGNKRTSAVLLFLLLERSGYVLPALEPDDDVGAGPEEVIYAVAEGRFTLSDVEHGSVRAVGASR